MSARTLVLALLLTASSAVAQAPPHSYLSMKTQTAKVGDLTSASSLQVEFPDGSLAQAEAHSTDDRISWDGNIVTRWIGHLNGNPDSEVALTQKGGLTVGTIRIGVKTWYLDPDGVLLRIEPTTTLPCGTTVRNHVPEALHLQEKSSSSTKGIKDNSPPYIDLLAVYDSTFVADAQGQQRAEVLIEDAVARASQAVLDSHAGKPYRLVGIVKLSQDIPSRTPFTVLFGSEVKKLRDQYGADLVQGYVSKLYARLNGSESPEIEVGGLSAGYHNGADTGYPSVVAYSAIHATTVAHELGHTGGADHEESTALRPAPARPFGYCPEDGSDGWGTIMWSGQNPLPERCIWNKLNYFSNPYFIYNAKPLGILGKQDNALVMRTTAPQLEAFRAPVVPLSTECVPSEEKLCLNAGRFEVKASWVTRSSEAGYAKVVKLTEDTGYLWFFSASNVEVVVKVLNGCPLNNHFWVFAGGLTDVGVVLTITDTRTGGVHQYTNTLGYPFAPIQDTSAFPTCP